MVVLTPGVSPEGFFRGLQTASRRALLLDYDGTLAPFSSDRDRAFPYAGVPGALAAILAQGSTRVAVVSGRAARDVLPLLELDPRPEIWGSHGLERLGPDDSYEAGPVEPQAADLLAEAGAWLIENGWGRLLERKPFGLALHARGASEGDFVRAREAALRQWGKALSAVGLEPLEFDGGIEWRPSGGHKGEVVRTVLVEEGPRAAVAYLGDDRTDEDAFAALAGRGLSVLVRRQLRPTLANLWIRPPEELLDFLDRWRRDAGGPTR